MPGGNVRQTKDNFPKSGRSVVSGGRGTIIDAVQNTPFRDKNDFADPSQVVFKRLLAALSC